jgi:hypothetical protein
VILDQITQALILWNRLVCGKFKVFKCNKHTSEYYGYLEQLEEIMQSQAYNNYSNSTTYKTTIASANNADTSGTNADVGLWRNTNCYNFNYLYSIG